MTLNIEDPYVSKLVDEIVQMTGEPKTEAVRIALEERARKLTLNFASVDRKRRLTAFLEDEVWPLVPVEMLGTELTRVEEETLFGYGES